MPTNGGEYHNGIYSIEPQSGEVEIILYAPTLS